MVFILKKNYLNQSNFGEEKNVTDHDKLHLNPFSHHTETKNSHLKFDVI